MSDLSDRRWAWEQALQWQPIDGKKTMGDHEVTANAILTWLTEGKLPEKRNAQPD